MSDPVTNADIEDVLSSIRRLVSENASPQPVAQDRPVAPSAASADPAQAPVPDPTIVEKLVLTPAFRVHEQTQESPDLGQERPGETASELEEAQDATSERAQDGDAPMATPLEARSATPSDGVMFLHSPIHVPEENNPDDIRPEIGGEDHPDSNIDASTDHQELSAPEILGTEDADAAPDAEYDSVETLTVEAEQVQSQSDNNAEAQAQTQPQQPDVDADADWQYGADRISDVTEEGTDAEQEIPGAQSDSAEGDFDWHEDAEKRSEHQPSGDENNGTGLEHRVAELEAAVNESAVEFEPDLGDAVEDLGPGIFLRRRAHSEEAAADVSSAAQEEPEQDWAEFDAEVAAFIDEDKEIEGTASPVSTSGETDQDAAQPIFASDEVEADLIDEEVLRELVVRLVREELQGAVGEKITRNVRRLVRREVERALTLKSLE